jgi:PII-like signaling protein
VTGSLLRIRLYESDQRNWHSRAIYSDIVHHLWQQGAPGVTVFHDSEGYDAHGKLQRLDSDYMANVPITLEVYGLSEEVQEACREIGSLLPKTSLVFVLSNVLNVKEANGRMQSTADAAEWEKDTGYVLRVYMKESDQYHHLPLYEALLLELKKHGVLWVDVQRALEGFGADHVLRKTAWLSFSSQAPLVLEATCKADSVGAMLDAIHPLLEQASGPAVMFRGSILSVGGAVQP